jgi:hypothetical protein
MDRIEIVVPMASGEAILRGSYEKRVLGIGKAKMGMTGRLQIFLQKASKLSKEWGSFHNSDGKILLEAIEGVGEDSLMRQ